MFNPGQLDDYVISIPDLNRNEFSDCYENRIFWWYRLGLIAAIRNQGQARSDIFQVFEADDICILNWICQKKSLQTQPAEIWQAHYLS